MWDLGVYFTQMNGKHFCYLALDLDCYLFLLVSCSFWFCLLLLMIFISFKHLKLYLFIHFSLNIICWRSNTFYTFTMFILISYKKSKKNIQIKWPSCSLESLYEVALGPSSSIPLLTHFFLTHLCFCHVGC